MRFIEHLENVNIYFEAAKSLYDSRDYLLGEIEHAAFRPEGRAVQKKSTFRSFLYGRTKRLRPLARKRANRLKRHSVSVCIPTYRETDLAFASIDSVLGQEVHGFTVEVVVVVNGGNADWAKKLENRYSSLPSVRIISIEEKGASVARNVAIKEAKGDFIAFLDDDDRFSAGYLSSLVDCIHPKADIVCGEFTTEGDSGVDYSYTNKALEKLRKTGFKAPGQTGLFASMCGKLFRRSFLLDAEKLDEGLTSSEDVVFWADNYDRLRSRVAFVSSKCGESYIRTVSRNSVSRPAEERAYSFYVSERLGVIARLESSLFEKATTQQGRSFVLNLISAQSKLMKDYAETLEGERKEKARREIEAYRGLLLNKSFLSNITGVAFCHNFSPYVDPSAMVSSKRLHQINEDFGEMVRWHVFAKDMSDIRKKDAQWEALYARFAYCEKMLALGKTSDLPKYQMSYAVEAYLKASSLNASVIYSRSMFPGSHIAAYLYKRDHPEAVWYAEFSDPIAKNSSGEDRDKKTLEQDCYSDFYASCEVLPYKHADKIIFTNAVQMEYMLGYCCDREAAVEARRKALAWHHPQIDHRYVGLVPSSYAVDKSKINVGFFGSFYARRSVNPMIELSKNNDVLIHLFVPDKKRVPSDLPSNFRVSDVKPYFEFLSTAGKMDYLFLSDMEPLDGVTPWLPSKLSDYLAVGVPIIALCNEGSPLSMIDSPSIIKVFDLDELDSVIDQIVQDQ